LGADRGRPCCHPRRGGHGGPCRHPLGIHGGSAPCMGRPQARAATAGVQGPHARSTRRRWPMSTRWRRAGAARLPRGGAMAALDVGLSSLANLGLSVVAMSVLTLAEFGAFSTTLLITLIVTGFVKALTSEPLTLRYAAAPSGV